MSSNALQLELDREASVCLQTTAIPTLFEFSLFSCSQHSVLASKAARAPKTDYSASCGATAGGQIERGGRGAGWCYQERLVDSRMETLRHPSCITIIALYRLHHPSSQPSPSIALHRSVALHFLLNSPLSSNYATTTHAEATQASNR